LRRKSLPWTDHENERLIAFVANGASVIRAAAAFDRTTASVRAQARKLGTPFTNMRAYRKKFANDPSSSWRQY
jgi:hypothetical protein